MMENSMLPMGIIIDCSVIFVATIVGSLVKGRYTRETFQFLMSFSGISAVCIGVISLIRQENISIVLFSLGIGLVIGEKIQIYKLVKKAAQKIFLMLNLEKEMSNEEYVSLYLLVMMIFCASGTNIFGAITEGLNGDATILIAKSVMDVFGAFTFATVLGFPMLLIIIPQCVILGMLFFLSSFMAPYITATAIDNFVSVGGVITLVIGLDILNFKSVNAINLLPALLIVFLADGVARIFFIH
ncbi:DUF554 family protein [Megasphaera cerevisiae]|uniref:DUF554 family protein n=1 Tax=Megasphaera cerevisiae TaxID=39029 RepID=UPI0009997E04|nr:DUF554 family protein [Megasphaera cerevisiae]